MLHVVLHSVLHLACKPVPDIYKQHSLPVGLCNSCWRALSAPFSFLVTQMPSLDPARPQDLQQASFPGVYAIYPSQNTLHALAGAAHGASRS
jgi:hypothetical protein